MAARDPRLRAFVKLDRFGQVVPNVLLLRYFTPRSGGPWREITPNYCCTTTTTTTTSTSTSTTTTTTTT